MVCSSFRLVSLLLTASTVVCHVALSVTRSDAQVHPWQTPQTTPLPDVTEEGVRKAYMNCLLEVDKVQEEDSFSRKAREEESRSRLKFCDNRKKDCSLQRQSADCRTFVEEFASE